MKYYYIFKAWIFFVSLSFYLGTLDLFSQTAWCNYPISGEIENLGLYGAENTPDISISPSNRIFAAVASSPNSLFYSDDSAQTWSPAFPNDSLVYECNKRGWGGGCERVLANSSAWVLAYINSTQMGYLSTAAVLSHSNGDSNSWQTLIDAYTLRKNGYTYIKKINGITLSDYYAIAFAGPLIIRSDNQIYNVINLLPSIADTASTVLSVALTNNASGLPMFFVVDTSSGNYKNVLYKYDGIVAQQIPIPSDLNKILNIYNFSILSSPDSLLISGYDTINSTSKIYKTIDGGTNWIDITPGMNLIISDVDFSTKWSNKCFFIADNYLLSKDFGSTWTVAPGIVDNGLAVLPTMTNYLFKSRFQQIYYSSSGISGTWLKAKNIGLSQVEIKDISYFGKKSATYVSTAIGVAYTTRLSDTLLQNYEKWEAPYGEFPLSSLPTDSIIYNEYTYNVIEINPWDSLNVITGNNKGFYVTQSGPNGFSLNTPINYGNYLQDIEFLDSTNLIAVFWGNADSVSTGAILRSADKGSNWVDVTPTGFSKGQIIEKLDSGIVFVGTGAYSSDLQVQGALWKSLDSGFTWTMINNDASIYTEIVDIAANPYNNNVIYIACAADTFRLLKSMDGGATFSELNKTTNEDSLRIRTINFWKDSNAVVNADTLIFGSGRSIGYYSTISDSMFFDIYQGFAGFTVGKLEIGSILVGTTTGFYTINIEGLDDIAPGNDTDTTVTHIGYFNLQENEILLYPNPVLNELNIQFPNQFSEKERWHVSIINNLGIKVKEYKNMYAVNGRIACSTINLIDGIYTIETQNYSKTHIFMNKIIIQPLNR